MKKLLCMMMCAILAFTFIAAVSAADVVSGTAAKGTPVIDGIIDDVWATTESMSIDLLKEGAKTDNVATWKGLWDENAFYVLIEVKDSQHFFEGHPSIGDGVELYFDPLNLEPLAYDCDEVCYFGIKGNDVNNNSFDGSASAIEYFKECYNIVAVETKDGFIYEASFKLNDFTPGIKMVEGTVIAFDIQVNDKDDASEVRTAAYGWSDGNNLAWMNPFVYGKVTFVAGKAPAAEVEKIDEFGAELIGKWTFEGNAVNEVTGVAAYTDGLQYVEGKNGQGAFFNKATMEFPIEFVTETDAITISMWTKWDWINNYDRLIEFFAEGDKETLAFWVCPLTNSGGLESNLYDALGNRHSNVNNGGQTQIPLEEWTNITLVAGEGEGNYRLYVNGQLAMAGTLTAPLYEYDFTKAGVGGLHYYGNTIADLTLDDIYFFDGILTDAEVASLVANGYEAPAAPVVEEPVVETPVVEEPVVDAPVVEAPKTADAIVIIAAASILSAGTAIISKKRR